MSYSDALVSQLYLLDYWRHNTEESEFIYEGLKGFVMSPRSLQQNMANIFRDRKSTRLNSSPR